jgi:hypothetical protein
MEGPRSWRQRNHHPPPAGAIGIAVWLAREMMTAETHGLARWPLSKQIERAG